MPTKPKKPCQHPGCRNLTSAGYCEAHEGLRKRDKAKRTRHYDKYQRDKKARDFYHSKGWELLRKQALMRDHGLCKDCFDEQLITPAHIVDHIKPVHQFWELRLQLDNLRSLCQAHHNRKTAEDKKRYDGKG